MAKGYINVLNKGDIINALINYSNKLHLSHIECKKLKDENKNLLLTIEELELRPPIEGGRLFLEGRVRAVQAGMME